MAEVTVLPSVFALEMVGVYSPGIPNQERIYLKANFDLNLGEYFIVTGWQITNDFAIPLNLDVFWLGNLSVSAGTWVVIYTGPGEQKITRLTTGEPALVLHWGKQTTVFTLPQVVPVLIHIDAVKVGQQVRTT